MKCDKCKGELKLTLIGKSDEKMACWFKCNSCLECGMQIFDIKELSEKDKKLLDRDL